MKAFYARGYGGPELMEYGELPDPLPRRGEVRVAVHASSVNPADRNVRSGMIRLLTGNRFPRPLGLDLAGVVDELGPGIESLAVGDRVYGTVDTLRGLPGAHAELVCVPVATLRRLPDALGFTEAAALPVCALTALNGLRIAGERAAGRVLITGATESRALRRAGGARAWCQGHGRMQRGARTPGACAGRRAGHRLPDA